MFSIETVEIIEKEGLCLIPRRIVDLIFEIVLQYLCNDDELTLLTFVSTRR